MLNIKCNKTTFTFLQASLNLQFEGSHWLIFHMHFHYIWRWKLYGCIRGAPDGATVAARWRRGWYQRRQRRRRDVVTSASFTSKDWITKLEMDSVSIHQRRRRARHGMAWRRTVHGGSPIHQLIDEFSFVTFRTLSMIDPKSFFNSSWNM